MRKGFTLVELLIVVGMLALLAASMSPLLGGNQDQAYLARTADSVRQELYETAMRAKTGAMESVRESNTVWGFLVSVQDQEIQSLSLTSLSFREASEAGMAQVLADSVRSPNLLGSENAREAYLSSLSPSREGGENLDRILLLFEPVSNRVALLTPQGPLRPLPEELYLTLQTRGRASLGRTLLLNPSLSTISHVQ